MVTYTYKWSLRKGGAKMICPQCGKKRFVPFVLTADGKTLAGVEFGRCDREQSCGYFRYPSGEAKVTVEVEPRPELPPALFAFGDYDIFLDDLTKNSLIMAYYPLTGYNKIADTCRVYHVRTGYGGECIYPQYDGDFFRTAKAISYGEDGHRLKDTDGKTLPVYWMHKAPAYSKYMQAHQLKQCFFGQHLLRLHPTAEVWIVEAEKTAVLMAATDERTARVWLACGGSQMLKGAIDLQCLEGRDVVLVPDDGQYWNWKRTADANGWACADISQEVFKLNLKSGADIWDIKEKLLTWDVPKLYL